MNVAELRDKSFVVPNVVIEIAFLPEVEGLSRLRALLARLDRDFGFEDLHEAGKYVGSRLTHQQMDVLGHDDVAIDAHFEALPGEFERLEKRVFHVHLREKGTAVETTECQAVRLSRVVQPLKSIGHGFPASVQDCFGNSTPGVGCFAVSGVRCFCMDGVRCFPALATEKRRENGARGICAWEKGETHQGLGRAAGLMRATELSASRVA